MGMDGMDGIIEIGRERERRGHPACAGGASVQFQSVAGLVGRFSRGGNGLPAGRPGLPAGVYVALYFFSFAIFSTSICLSSFLRILPTALLGRLGMNSMILGTL